MNIHTLPDRFEAQVRKSPMVTAAVCAVARLSYAELNAKSNQLAYHLIDRGISSEDIVAIALPRSVDMIVAMLGILKAGAAYLPLDPEYPAGRLAFMLNDSSPKCLISATSIATSLRPACPVLSLDDAAVRLTLARGPDTNPANKHRIRPLLPLNPAYIIYTSGSTGAPKGVVVTHSTLVASTQARLDHYPPQDAFLLLPSIAFDSSVAVIFWSLLMGSKLVLPKTLDFHLLRDLIDSEGVTTWLSIPSLYKALTDSFPSRDVRSEAPQTVIFAGEQVTNRHVAAAGDKEIYNEYGPTEATVWSTVEKVRRDDKAISIGRAIQGTQLYVLDDDLKAVPTGVTGELYVAGIGLTRGYLGRPSLTAERFIANPFGASGERMYRTGDLVSWRAEGVLDFRGRIDNQIKIRGFRIEPGEIERVLGGHPSISESVVVARDDRIGQKQLVGYVVQRGTIPLDLAALRCYLSEHLPDHMVPAAIIVVEALPLMPNGKVDRLRLTTLGVS